MGRNSVGCDAGGDNVRQRGNADAQLLEVIDPRFPRRIGVFLQRNAGRNDIVGIVAEWYVQQMQKATHSRTRSREQHKRERNLRSDKRAVQAPAEHAASGPVSTLLHDLADLGLRHLQSRNQSEEYRAQQLRCAPVGMTGDQ
jgi:hypothetical protein